MSNDSIVIYNWPSIFYERKSDRLKIESTKEDTGPNESTYYYSVSIDDIPVPSLNWKEYSGWGTGSQAHFIPYDKDLFKKLKELFGNMVNMWYKLYNPSTK